VPALRLVIEPLAQLGAGGDGFEPEIDGGILARQAARPEPIDQHAGAVRLVGGLVDALDPPVGAHSSGSVATNCQTGSGECSWRSKVQSSGISTTRRGSPSTTAPRESRSTETIC